MIIMPPCARRAYLLWAHGLIKKALNLPLHMEKRVQRLFICGLAYFALCTLAATNVSAGMTTMGMAM